MPRGTGEVFTCPKCGNKQPLNKAAHRSINCIGCETVYAIVKDDEGGKALVPFYNQGTVNHDSQSESATSEAPAPTGNTAAAE